MVVYFFFFQAEDGIRDVAVTGVQTCALPILCLFPQLFVPPSCQEVFEDPRLIGDRLAVQQNIPFSLGKIELLKREPSAMRSEERRVGKEYRSRWSPDHEKKK